MRIVDGRTLNATLTRPALPFVNQTDGYAIPPTDSAICVTGAISSTVTLPVTGLSLDTTISVSNGLSAGSNVTVNATGGPVIGNSVNGTSDVLWATGAIGTYRWNGSEWWVVAH